MNIIIFEAKKRDRLFFKRQFKNDKLTFVDEPLHEGNAKTYSEANVACVFIFSKVSKEVIAKLPKLKLIATRSTGYDHIAVKEATKRGISVCNVPEYGSNTVAEHTFALILNLSRNVHKSYVRSRQDNFEINDLTGFDLKDKWLGVIGVGNIGQHVIKIAKGFGMHVIAYDSRPNQFLADLLHFTYAKTVEEVLKKSDILSLHVPSNKETFHMINKKNIGLIKKGALLINTSRGDIIDTDALYASLKNGRLSGAGLDVVEGEQHVKEDKALLVNQDSHTLKSILENQEILHMDNVVYTPHNAFNSTEALQRILEVTAENIRSVQQGKPKNTVNITKK